MNFKLSDAIEKTRRLVYGSTRPIRNQLETTIDATTTTVVCSWSTLDLPKRALIAVDGEMMFVWDKVDATSTLSVSRGELGTDASAHTSTAMIEVNPRFPRPVIAAAIQEEIMAWEPDLYRVVDLAPISTTAGIADIGVDSSEVYSVLNARFARVAVIDAKTTWVDAQATLIRGLDTVTFPSGVGVQVIQPSNQPASTSVHGVATSIKLTLGLPFDLDAVTETSDLVDDVGLARSMVDVAVWGAAVRLLASAEVPRTDPSAQGQSRDATQVRVGDQLQVAAALMRVYNQRYAKEVEKLQRRYPIRAF